MSDIEVHLPRKVGAYVWLNTRAEPCQRCNRIQPWYTSCSDESAETGECGPVIFLTDDPHGAMVPLGYRTGDPLEAVTFHPIKPGAVVGLGTREE